MPILAAPDFKLPTSYPTPERAIEAACRLMDAGCDVYGIGTGPLTDSIGREQIARIYALWNKPVGPFEP